MSTVEFGSLFQFIRNGKNVKQNKSGEGIPITRIETISEAVVDGSRVGYAGLVEGDCANWLLEPGDILFSHINSLEHIGKCAIYQGKPAQLVHGMNLLNLRSDTTRLLPEFGKYLIRSTQFRSLLSKSIKKAVNQASVSIGDLRAIPVNLPPISEQRRIAAILDKADELRAKRRAALAQLDTLTQSIFLDMFGDPATNPKGWPSFSLGAMLLDVTNGMTRRRLGADVAGHDIVLRLRDIREGWIDFSEINRITLRKDEAEKYEVNRGDLLFIRVNGNPGYVGRCALFSGFPEKVYFNDHVMRVRADPSKVSGAFLAFLLNGSHGKREIARHRKTSAGQHTINQEGLASIRLPVPPLRLQLEFGIRISKIELTKNSQAVSLASLEALFASLQHRAFRGEL